MMENNNFDLKFYLSMLRTARAVGMQVVNEEDLIQLLAIVYFEDGNEEMTHHYKFIGDIEFAQEIFHIHGGERPYPWFVEKLKTRIEEIRAYKAQHKGEGYPDWAKQLVKSRYDIELRG